ncbi:MAG: ABC transporter substrate-binding protein [Oscillatoriales cyanobacterium SM2_1_8]|nr:ABC transporter substrate-binding protein [Oscillatoriales cyanobacterium SM2_1_8]
MKIFQDVQNLTISVVRIYPDVMTVYLENSFVGNILKEAGFARPPGQRLSDRETKNQIQIEVGRENIFEADADVIFVWDWETSEAAKRKTQKQIQALRADPLWQHLKAVQNGRVYQVPGYWIGSGLIAAHGVVDDLSKFLLEK